MISSIFTEEETEVLSSPRVTELGTGRKNPGLSEACAHAHYFILPPACFSNR